MYIRRKVFSLLNVEGEDRYFSTTDYVNAGEGEVKLFSEKKEEREPLAKAKNRVALKDLGTLGGSVMGAHYAKKAGNKAADEADARGASDEEIIAEAKKAARNSGEKMRKAATAIDTAALGTLGAVRGNQIAKVMGKKAGLATASGAVGGAAVGYGLGKLAEKIDKRARGKMAEREAKRRVKNRGK